MADVEARDTADHQRVSSHTFGVREHLTHTAGLVAFLGVLNSQKFIV